MAPSVRRVGTLYTPYNPVYQHNAMIARNAAHQLNVELVEWPVTSAEEASPSRRRCCCGRTR
jgi:ABC-type uncharacterized transport system substrate-binding protein